MTQETNANLVRRYVDVELSPEERHDVEQRLETDAALHQQVRFERTLRDRVASVLRAETPSAPPDLAMRIGAAMRESSPLSESPPAEPPRGSGGWLLARLRDPHRANGLAVAATIMLVLGAVLFGILGSPIDEWGARHDRDADPSVVEAATWASDEHGRCTYDPSHLERKASLSRDAVRQDFAKHMGRPVPAVVDLQQLGFEFVGAGHCMVPGPAPSGHLVFRRSDGAMVSLFLVPDVSQLGSGMPRGRWFRIDGSSCRHQVRCATDGNLLYLLVCCDTEVVDSVAGSVIGQIARQAGMTPGGGR